MNPTNTGPGRPSDDTVKTKTATEADIAANESLKRNPTLCHYCRNICDNWPAAEFESPSFEHYGTEKELLDSAEAGCGICAQACADESYSQLFKLVNGSWVLQYGVLISMPAPSAQNHTTGIVSLSSHGPDCYDIRIFTPNIDLVESHLLEHRFQYRKVRLSAYGNASIPGSLLQASCSPSTKDGLPLARFWLDSCDTTHQCLSTSEPSFTPTRLVDLTNAKARLHSYSGTEAHIKYATLSHCWGRTQRPVLIKDYLQNYHKEIPADAISTTFRDAMMVAKMLGFKYIWIDSLCITQDCRDDWERESALMTKVYSNSGLNISAAGARDGSVGLFFPRDEKLTSKFNMSSEESTTPHTWFLCSVGFEQLTSMPLMRRGWAFQERVLAPRTVHFTQSQLYWECNEVHACELIPQGYFRQILPTIDFGDTTLRAVSTWKGIVNWYSQRELTKSRDKLVAISGLARAGQSDLLGKYVAGFWSKDLVSQLCWNVHLKLGHRPPKYIAPSWSWASIDGPISMPGYLTETVCIQVQDAVVVSAVEGNAFGEVLSGTLSLSCEFLLAIDVSKSETTYNSERLETTFQQDGLEIDLIIDSRDDEVTVLKPTKQVYLLPGDFGRRWGRGLAIVSADNVLGRYQRVGYFQTYFENDRFREVLLAGTLGLGEGVYARIATDENGKTLRIIDIV